jgi:putative flippase GtrA
LALCFISLGLASDCNVLAFCIAVTFSFFANAKWTFKSRATSGRYLAFVLFMGIMAGLTGYLADSVGAPPIVTLLAFSGFSLVAGSSTQNSLSLGMRNENFSGRSGI